MTPEQFIPLTADLIVAGGVLLLLIGDLLMPAGDKRVLGWAAIAVLAGALGSTFFVDMSGASVGNAYVGDGLALFFKRVFLVGGILAVLGSLASVADLFPRRQGEYYQLVLFSILGMTLLAGARDIILLVVAFELMGLPLYVLAGFRRRDAAAAEGAIKLFLIGAVSSMTMLFGLSIMTGLAGTTQIAEMAAHAAASPSPAMVLGATLTFAGMGFKLGVFPFHMWVPDTYQGATTPFVSFLSTAPKAAGLVAILQIFLPADQVLLTATTGAIVVLAAATIVFGNFLALNQSDVKRLLGYSGVAHMGFLLMALLAGNDLGVGVMLFYVAGYLFTNIGAFLVVHAVARAGGDDSISSFDGLVSRSGWLSMTLLVFLLSLAGIPFVVGFWAKLFVFMAAWSAGYGWLVILGAVFSVVALFYYLRVARAMFMNAAPEGTKSITVDPATNLGIAACLAFVVLMGVWPAPFIESALAAARGFLGG